METGQNGNKRSMFHYAAQKLGVPVEQIDELIAEYMDMQVLYRSAIREVSTRLEILDDEFQFRHKRNPIHIIQTRLKSPQSMMEKMGRRNLTPSIGVMRSELTDIAGVRVICSYIDDIYHLAELLCKQDGVEKVRVHDYIKHPKPNGYRSLHLVIRVPVHFSNSRHMVPVEIQIRTIAMDFWASLEHELRYKGQKTHVTKEIAAELRECADHICELDRRMQAVYHRLEVLEEEVEPEAQTGPAPQKVKTTAN